MENEKINESLCDKVRFAVSFGEELTYEMKKHLEECDECRTFLEQTEKMTDELSALGVQTFMKDGKSVADSVMEEVNRQTIFTAGKPVKSRKFIRHAGLIAACLIIVVMAAPVMESMFGGAKSDDAVYDEDVNMSADMYSKNAGVPETAAENELDITEEYSYSIEDGNINQAHKYIDSEQEADSVTADYYGIKEKDGKILAVTGSTTSYFARAEAYNAALADDIMPESTTETSASESKLDMVTYNDSNAGTAEDAKEFAVNGDSGSSGGGGSAANASQAVEPEESISDDIYAVANAFAETLCEDYGFTLDSLVSLTYPDKNIACAVYVTVSGEQITLQLNNNGFEWSVVTSEIYLNNQ